MTMDYYYYYYCYYYSATTRLLLITIIIIIIIIITIIIISITHGLHAPCPLLCAMFSMYAHLYEHSSSCRPLVEGRLVGFAIPSGPPAPCKGRPACITNG